MTDDSFSIGENRDYYYIYYNIYNNNIVIQPSFHKTVICHLSRPALSVCSD